jgi:hypothetical protein
MSKKRHKHRHKAQNKREQLNATQKNGRTAGVTAIVAALGTLLLALAGILWALNHVISICLLLIGFIIYGVGLFVELSKHKWKTIHVWLCSGFVIVLGIVLCAELILWDLRQEDEFSGVLIPANDPTPMDAQAPTNAITLVLGNTVNEVFWFPHTVLIYKGKPMLTISKTPKGAAISGEFFGDNEDVVAVLENNRFTINRLNYFTKERPDRSTLIVRDQKNIEVLNVRFMNPHTIKLLGRFRLPNAPDVIIDENQGMFASHIHSIGNGVDYVVQ